MLKEKMIQGIELVAVAISLLLAMIVFQKANPERFFGEQEPMSASQIAATYGEKFAGRPAGDDVTRLKSGEEFDELSFAAGVTVEPVSVISTGVYSLNPWESRTVRRRRGTTTRSEAVDNIFLAVNGYQEFYLVELEDGSYILAQFSDLYREKIQLGQEITLPIGVKKAVNGTARSYLRSICREYGADREVCLYMINNEWSEEHNTVFFFIRLLIAVPFFFLCGGLMITLIEKVGKKRSE